MTWSDGPSDVRGPAASQGHDHREEAEWGDDLGATDCWTNGSTRHKTLHRRFGDGDLQVWGITEA